MTTLREHLECCGQSELLSQFRRLSPESYDDFIGILNSDLEDLIGLVEADAKDFIESSEDELNRELVRLLRARFYSASHDHDEGGHVDIRVQSRDGRYSWLAEAKLDNGPAYLEKGVHQLTDRYVRGTPGHNCGALIVYVQRSRCAERFENWKKHFQSISEKFEELSFTDCHSRKGLSFYSEFVLSRMGAGAPRYQIRHLAVSAFRVASAA